MFSERKKNEYFLINISYHFPLPKRIETENPYRVYQLHTCALTNLSFLTYAVLPTRRRYLRVYPLSIVNLTNMSPTNYDLKRFQQIRNLENKHICHVKRVYDIVNIRCMYRVKRKKSLHVYIEELRF